MTVNGKSPINACSIRKRSIKVEMSEKADALERAFSAKQRVGSVHKALFATDPLALCGGQGARVRFFEHLPPYCSAPFRVRKSLRA